LSSDKCYLCLRISEEQVIEAVKLLFPKNEQKKVLNIIHSAINQAYKNEPSFFCGKKAKRILGGLIHLIALVNYPEYKITQKDILKAINCSKYTIREGLYDWKWLIYTEKVKIPELKINLSALKEELSHVSTRRI